MANFVVALGYNSTSTPLHETRKDVNVMYMADKMIDLSSTTMVASTYQNNYNVSLAAIVSGDTIDCIPMPKFTLVTWGGWETMRAATANTDGTIALSIVAPSTTLVSAVTCNDTGLVLSSVTFLGGSAATAYTGQTAVIVSSANGTNVRVTVGTSALDAKIRVFAVMQDLNQVTTRVN